MSPNYWPITSYQSDQIEQFGLSGRGLKIQFLVKLNLSSVFIQWQTLLAALLVCSVHGADISLHFACFLSLQPCLSFALTLFLQIRFPPHPAVHKASHAPLTAQPVFFTLTHPHSGRRSLKYPIASLFLTSDLSLPVPAMFPGNEDLRAEMYPSKDLIMGSISSQALNVKHTL